VRQVPTVPPRVASVASWAAFTAEESDLAAVVRGRFAAHRHALLATLDRSGAPRISGLEVHFWHGELWLAMMPGSVKVADLRRDPRFALHGAPLDLDLTEGDAKVRGRAVEVSDPATIAAFARSLPQGAAPPTGIVLFRAEIASVSLVAAAPKRDRLIVATWRPGKPVVRREVR